MTRFDGEYEIIVATLLVRHNRRYYLPERIEGAFWSACPRRLGLIFCEVPGLPPISWHDVSYFSRMKPNAGCPIEQLVERYYQPVFHFAVQLSGDPVGAMILTQRTFRVALDRGRSLPVPANRRAWLITILFHKFLEARRRGPGLVSEPGGAIERGETPETQPPSKTHLLTGILLASRRRAIDLTAQPIRRATSLSSIFPGHASAFGFHRPPPGLIPRRCLLRRTLMIVRPRR